MDDLLIFLPYTLPALNKLFPFGILIEMAAKYIMSAGGRFFGNMKQFHVDLLQLAAPFAMIAGWASSHHVGPDVLSAHMLGQHMIDG